MPPGRPSLAAATPGSVRQMPTDGQVAAAVAALTMAAEPSRLRILWAVSGAELDVGTLASLAGTSPTAASQHLAKLRLAGLVSTRRDGRRVLYSACGAHVRRLITEALFHADHVVTGHPPHE
jgi:DNA-binding transcriptional ArsR family regulator